DSARVARGRGIGRLAGAVRRLIVDDEYTHGFMFQQRFDERLDVLTFVVRRNDHQRLRHDRPSKRSDEICSEMSPTRRTTTLNRMRSTEELVTCDCVTIVQSA